MTREREKEKILFQLRPETGGNAAIHDTVESHCGPGDGDGSRTRRSSTKTIQ
jgi:hypothetical protein